jgi:exopolyphosphatase/guanosine-5'-triphosphate,3'-diphosphate pyrophosphatase
MNRVAVIDTGTNSTRLLVAERSDDGIREILREANITRLGEGVDSRGLLSDSAMERVYGCMGRYAASIGELEAGRALIIATSSVRDAGNGPSFIDSLARNFSFEGRVLSGEEEAALSFAGAMSGVPAERRGLLFDVGGGSTEVVVGRDGQTDFSVSMDIGCVRIKERFFNHDPADEAELAEAADFIDSVFAELIPRRELEGLHTARAVAGTVTTLAAIDAGLETYNREKVHGHVLRRTQVDRLLGMLARMTVNERLMIPTMETGRADVIVAGGLIVSRLLEYTGIDEFMVSELDILDGAALAMLNGRL